MINKFQSLKKEVINLYENIFVNNFIEKNLTLLNNSELFILHTLLKSNMVNRRVKQDVELALKLEGVHQKDYKKLIEEIMKGEKEALSETSYRDLRLNNIQVKNFKGFGDEVNDDDKGVRIVFNENNNIFFAPNGGGKTSLSNALEYGITGKIKEAKRRDLSIPQYINRNSKRPELTIEMIDNKNNIISVFNAFQKEVFENAFVEHNRINAFSLLESRDSRDDHRDIISYILGLEELEEFMSYFIQPGSFTIEQHKKTLINEKMRGYEEKKRDEIVKIKELKKYIKKIKDNIPEEITKITNIKELNVNKIKKPNRKKIKQYVNELKIELKESEKSYLNQTKNKLPILEVRPMFKNKIKIKHLLEEYEKLSSEIEENLEKAHLINLFEVITNLTEDKYNKCPACQTDLEKTAINPFAHAKEELEMLQSLKTKQKIKQNIKQQLESDIYFKVVEHIRMYKEFEEKHNEINKDRNICFSKELLNLKDKQNNKLDFLKEYTEFISNNFEKIMSEIKYFDKFKKEYLLEVDQIEEEKEKDRLIEEHVNKINNYFDTWNSYLKDILKHYYEIKRLKTERLKNLNEIDKENKYNDFIEDVQKSYEDLYEKLYKYRNSKQSEEIEGTERLILNYYNQMNKNDSEQEKIDEISFELVKNKYSIMINTSEGKLNAFSKLSEGHLRALGLSIILAVAQKKELPILIFDDIVNAIDAEHRANIIELFYSDEYLRNTQLIITTHDRLFWERFSIKSRSESMLNSSILEYTNRGIILKQYHIDFDNKIRKSLEYYDVRQALIYSRLWFETLAMEYCRRKGHDIKGRLSTTNSLIVSMTPIINEMYNKVESEFGTTEQFKTIKNDLINWGGQNQEHHAFDESNYNFVHAKISDEVEEIYQAICELEIIMFEDKRTKYKNSVIHLNEIFSKLRIRLGNEGFLNGAEENVIKETRKKKESTKKELKRLTPLMEIIEQIEAN